MPLFMYVPAPPLPPRRHHASRLKEAADEWQARHGVARVLTMGFLSGAAPIVDLYELKVCVVCVGLFTAPAVTAAGLFGQLFGACRGCSPSPQRPPNALPTPSSCLHQVRLDHVLRRMRVLQAAASAEAPARVCALEPPTSTAATATASPAARARPNVLPSSRGTGGGGGAGRGGGGRGDVERALYLGGAVAADSHHVLR